MKRLLPLIALVALAGLSGCDAFDNDVAATVNGSVVSITEVQELAAALPAAPEGGPKTRSFRLNGADARQSLAVWIQIRIAETELNRRGVKVAADAVQSAEQSLSKQLDKIATMSRAGRTAFIHGYAASQTLVKEISKDTSADALDKLRDQVFDKLSPEQRELICLNGVTGPAAAAPQVQALLDQGSPLTDPNAFTPAGFQPLGQPGAEFCTTVADLPPEVVDTFRNAPIGTVTSAEFGQDPQRGVVFFDVTSRRELTRDDDQITQAVQQQLQQNPGILLAPIVKKADIDVDPRFGRGFDPTKGAVIPPQSPRTKSAAAALGQPTP